MLSIVRKRQVKYFCQNYCAINCLATLSQSSDFCSCKNKKGNLDIYFLYGYILGRQKNETYAIQQHGGVENAILHKNPEHFCFKN